MKVIAFNAPSSLETFTEIRVYDTDTGALTEGVVGIPPAPTNGSTIIVGVIDNYVFGYSTVQDEAYGKDAITAVFRSLIGVTPGSPSVTTLSGNPNTRLIDNFYGYAKGPTSIHIWINNGPGSSPRLANITATESSVSYTEQTVGTMTNDVGNDALLVTFEGGAKRIVTFPPTGVNTLTYSTVVGSGTLNEAGTVTMYTTPESTTNEEASALGLLNTAKLIDALSAFGTVTNIRSMYVFTFGGNNDGCGIDPYFTTGLNNGQMTVCYVVESEDSTTYAPHADVYSFNPGFTSSTKLTGVVYADQDIPPFVNSIVASTVLPTGVFWTAFKRASEQP